MEAPLPPDAACALVADHIKPAATKADINAAMEFSPDEPKDRLSLLSRRPKPRELFFIVPTIGVTKRRTVCRLRRLATQCREEEESAVPET